MSELREDLRQHLSMYAEMRKAFAIANPDGVLLHTTEEWVYKHGREMGPRVVLPPRLVRAGSNECYFNAWRYRARHKLSGLSYCEGFVMMEKVPIAILHGWLLNADGKIIDPSIEQDRETAYFGVQFKDDFAEKIWRKLRTPKIEGIGILPNLWRLRIKHEELQEGIQ